MNVVIKGNLNLLETRMKFINHRSEVINIYYEFFLKFAMPHTLKKINARTNCVFVTRV